MGIRHVPELDDLVVADSEDLAQRIDGDTSHKPAMSRRHRTNIPRRTKVPKLKFWHEEG